MRTEMPFQSGLSGPASRQDTLTSVDARTQLAGTNMMELLLFKLGAPEVYGINVFKVKEIIRTVDITQAPSQPEFVVGMASIRGQLLPVVDLVSLCGNCLSGRSPVMIITEFSNTTQAFLVESVDTIIRVGWNDVHQAPAMLSGSTKLTGVTRLRDGTLVSILDVEQILHSIAGDKPVSLESMYLPETQQATLKNLKIFFADDSAFARNQLKQILDSIGVASDFAVNGLDAWTRLDALAAIAEASGTPLVDSFPIVITDIEMPEMDGFMLTRKIKADPRFKGIKVLLHSSMSESSNKDKGIALGADGFLPKYKPREVAESLRSFLPS